MWDDEKMLKKIRNLFSDKKTKWVFIVLFTIIVALLALYFFVLRWQTYTYFGGMGNASFLDPSCNVAGINIHGELKTYTTLDEQNYDYASSEDILSLLWEAEQAENIKAIIVEIDSYGGSPVASQEIANEIKKIEDEVKHDIADRSRDEEHIITAQMTDSR